MTSALVSILHSFSLGFCRVLYFYGENHQDKQVMSADIWARSRFYFLSQLSWDALGQNSGVWLQNVTGCAYFRRLNQQSSNQDLFSHVKHLLIPDVPLSSF